MRATSGARAGRAAPVAPVAVMPHVVTLLPHAPGVYRFRDRRGRALYIGRASDLRRRVASYWGGLQDRPHLRRMVPQVARVEAVACDSAPEAAWLERNLLEQARPRWNRLRGGLEVPVWIVVDEDRTRARLRIVHEGDPGLGDRVAHGPHLGGTRARLAPRRP